MQLERTWHVRDEGNQLYSSSSRRTKGVDRVKGEVSMDQSTTKLTNIATFRTATAAFVLGILAESRVR